MNKQTHKSAGVIIHLLCEFDKLHVFYLKCEFTPNRINMLFANEVTVSSNSYGNYCNENHDATLSAIDSTLLSLTSW